VEVVTRLWLAFAGAVGAFLEEAAVRVMLAFDVLVGRMPRQAEKRWWNRATETPALLNVYSWTDERLIFSALIWSSLESSPEDADYEFHQRVREVKEAIASGVADKAWCTRLETDYGLRWDAKRQVWTASDGFSFEAPLGRSSGSGSEIARAIQERR
jgi:hypothetical protein